MIQTIKTVSYKLSLLQKLRKFTTYKAALQIYRSMVLPYFDYGDILYNCSSIRHLNKLHNLQNKGLKICFGHGTHLTVEEMHIEANLRMLQNRRIQHVLTFMFKQQNNARIVDIRNIRTRAHDAVLFNTRFPTCEKYKHNIFFYGAHIWNQLPAKERKLTITISNIYLCF